MYKKHKKVYPERVGTFGTHVRGRLFRLKATFHSTISTRIVGSTEAPSKVFLLFFLLPDWLKFNHLKSRIECGFSDIFSRHICST